MVQVRGGGSSRSRKTASEKGKGIARDDAADAEDFATTPWPRQEGTPFVDRGLVDPTSVTKKQIKASMRNTNYIPGSSWDNYHKFFYNGWLRIKKIQPSNVLCRKTLETMGIRDSVQLMLTMMGVSSLVSGQSKLYPDLVRQLYSSAEIVYQDVAHPRASEATFTYFAFGVQYSISIPDFCCLYGFANDSDSCTLPTPADFAEFPALWYLMANGDFHSRENRLTLIRNPVIRFVAKVVGHTLFAKQEAGSLTHDELVMLTYGLRPAALPAYTEPMPRRPLDINRGIIFAERLVEKKFRGIGPKAEDAIDVQGSLLTRLFQHHGIDLSNTECNDQIAYYDMDFFRRSRYMSANNVHVYYDRQGVERFFQLPNAELTRPITRANVEFLPPPEFQCTKPRGSSRKRQRVLRPPTQATAHAPPPSHYATQASASRSAAQMDEYVFPPFPPELDLMPLSADPTPEEDRLFARDTMKKLHAIQKRMWQYWSKIKISCLQPSETDDRDEDPPHAGVAGRHEDEDEDDDGAGHHFTDHGDHGVAGRQFDADMEGDIVRDSDDDAAAPPT